MQIRSKTLSYGDVCRIVERVSRERYAGNIIVEDSAHALYPHGGGYAGRIRAESSRDVGARSSWSGRRTIAACWHAYRDVLRAVFDADPSAVVVTMLARYEGKAGFENEYPRTADINIGSVFQPAYMPDLCDCED